MDFSELVKKNRSFRSFDESARVSKETLTGLVSLARLCPSSVNLQPLKFFLSCTEKTNKLIFPLTRWAGLLPDCELPPKGHAPTAYIVILCDKSIAAEPSHFMRDVGIAAQTMLLGAAEKGLGGCMIGSFDREKLSRVLSIENTLVPVLVIALGLPDETVEITGLIEGKTAYYRKDGIHYVPKRRLEELIISFGEE